jgi:hypothetical protein
MLQVDCVNHASLSIPKENRLHQSLHDLEISQPCSRKDKTCRHCGTVYLHRNPTCFKSSNQVAQPLEKNEDLFVSMEHFCQCQHATARPGSNHKIDGFPDSEMSTILQVSQPSSTCSKKMQGPSCLPTRDGKFSNTYWIAKFIRTVFHRKLTN